MAKYIDETGLSTLKGLVQRDIAAATATALQDGDAIPVSDVEFILQYGILPPDPILNNNSWATIKTVCEAGLASQVWNVGDIKIDIGTDNVERTMRICDMSGLYGKHVVFEQVECETTKCRWNSSNTDDDSRYNDYNIADIQTTLNVTIKSKYSTSLQSALTQTTFKVAKNGKSSTILDVTNYLFIPAEKEIFGSVTYSRTDEADVLTQYQWYVTHNTDNDRIKYRDENAAYWWLRSPYSDDSNYVCRVHKSGRASWGSCRNLDDVAPCFAF